MRKALTMIELIFVIIILGIVASIGAEIIAQVYESYIIQRAQYRATTKTELALNQIANRLRYAIPGTVGFRTTVGGGYQPITALNTGNDRVLQWVAYDGDSFETMSCVDGTAQTNVCRRPGWSGLCDIDAYVPGTTTLPTPGSDLTLAGTVIGNLGGNIGNARIYFPDGSSYGISAGAGENITLDGAIPAGNTIYERYKLAWSSYALSCENSTAEYPCGDLFLYHHMTPTVGAALNTGIRTLLLTRVSNLRFKGSEGSLRVKICKKEQIGAEINASVHTCKEKVIF